MKIKGLYIFFYFLTLFFSNSLQSQCSNLEVNSGDAANLITETIYYEPFTAQEGKGAIGNTTDLSGCNWSIDINAANLSNTGDWFKVSNVNGSERMEARDVDGICIWYSPLINILNYKNVSISLNASESGWLESNDIFYSEYSLDGASWTYFSNYGQLSDDFNSRTVTQNGLTGSSLQIRVSMNVDASNEYLRLDDVTVTGQAYKINLCYGDPLNLGGSPTALWSGAGNPTISYTWSPSNTLSDPNISNPVATPTSDEIYKVIASVDDNGVTCTDSSLFYVNVSPQIEIFSSSPVCVDDTLILSEYGGDASVWTWSSNGLSNIISFEDSSTQVVGMIDGEIFTVDIEDDFGCTRSSSVTIVVNPKPSNVTSLPYGSYCSSDSPFALNGGSPNGGYYDGSGVLNNNFDPSSVGYGSTLQAVDVMYIYQDLNGCRDTSISPVNIQQAPNVELSSPYLSLPPTDTLYLGTSPTGDWSKCGGSTPTFDLKLEITSLSVLNNSANVTYDIDFGDGNSISNIIPGTIYNNVYSVQGPYNIVVTATDNITGCVRTYSKTFFFGTNPSISLGIPGNTQNQCAPRTYGFVATFSDASGVLNSPGTTYKKYTNDGKPDSTFIHPSPATDLETYTIYHTFSDASCGYSTQAYDNSFLVGVSATNGCGSSSAEVSPITQSSPPEAAIANMDSIFCIDEPVTFLDSSSGGKYVYGVNSGSGFSYECDTIDAIAWKLTPDTGFTVLSGQLGNFPLNYFDTLTHGTSQIQIAFHNKGSYSMSLFKISPCGNAQIIDSSKKEIKIDSMPEASFLIDKEIDCFPLEIITTNTSRSLNDYNSSFSWFYSTLIQGCQGSAPPSITPIPADTLSAKYIFTKPGKYSINLTASNVCGSHTFKDTVIAKGPPVIGINPISDSCDNKSLWPTSSIDSCFGTMSKYTWAFPGSNTDSSYLKTPNKVLYDSISDFWVYGTASNECGLDIDSLNFTIFEDPIISMLDTDSVCIGDNIQVSPTVSNGTPGYSYLWNSNGSVSNNSSLNIMATSIIDEYYYLTTTDVNGCKAVDSILIDVQSLPVVDAGPNQNQCPEDTAFLSGSISGGMLPYSFNWDLASLSNTTILDPYYDMDGTSTFVLTATDAFGCINDDFVIINQYNSPVVNAGNDTSICNQSIAVDFNGLPNGGNWSGLNINTTGSFMPNGIGLEEVIYQYTDFNNCYNEDTILINVSDPILANAGLDSEICESQDSLILAGLPIGGVWSGSNVSTNLSSNLYEEFFTGLNGKGATNSGINLSGCNWSVDVSGLNLNYYYKYLKVNNNLLEARDLDGSAYWLSPTIDIEGYTNVSISISASEWGWLEVDDGMDFEYRINSGVWNSFDNNGSLYGNFTSSLASSSSIIGNTLEVRVKFINNSSSEYLRIDNVIITGEIPGLYTVVNPDTVNLVYTYGLNNCANNDTFQLVINSLPVVDAGLDLSLCVSDSIQLIGNPLGGSWTGNGVVDPLGKFLGDSSGVGLHTVYYRYSDSNSCENMDSLKINVLSLPVIDAGNDTILCNQPGVVDFDANLNPGYWTGSHVDSSGGFEPNGVSIYDLYYHHTDANGCYNNDTLQINVIDPTNADAGIDQQMCIDSGLVQFIGLPIGGIWSGAGISFDGFFTTSVQDTIDFVYSFGTGNCLTRDTFNLIINPLPNLDAGIDFEVCIDDTIQVLVPNLSGGSWSGTGITNINGDFNPSVAGAGIHKLYYYYKDSNSCDIIDSLEATVHALPIVTTPADTNICDLPSPVNFTAFPLGGNWLGPNISPTGTYTPNGSGVFDLYYEYTDINGCYNMDTISLTVDIPQIADAGQDIQACLDTGLIQLTGFPLGAGTWDGPVVSLNGDYDVVFVDTVDLAYNIGSGNCFTTDTMNLLIHPLPVVIVDNSFEICISNGDTSLNFSPFGGIWSGNGVDPISGVFNPVSAGVGTHRLLYSYQHPVTACWNYDSLDLTVNPLPVVSYSHDSIFCLNSGHQILNTTTEVQNHFWNISDGSFSSSESPQFIIDTIGFFDINYVAQTERGCLDSLSSSIEVVAPPLAIYSAPDSGCGPLIVDFTNNSYGKYVSYLWDLGFDNYLGGDSITTDTVPADHTYPAGIYFDTTYYTSLTVTNMCGTDISTLDVISMPQPVSLFGPNTNVGCLSGTITFANNSYGLPDTFYWDFGDGNFGNNSDTIFDHYYPPGTSNSFYTVTMAVSNECGTDTSYENLTILPSNLVAFFSVDTTVGCAPFTVDFTQFSIGGTSSSWDFGDGNFSNAYSPIHTYLDTGTYQVRLAVSSTCNYDTAYKTIRVNTSPNVAFSVLDDTLCAGSTFLFNNLSDTAISYNWDFGDGTTSYLTQPTHIFSSEGLYNVILTGTSLTNDCPAYDSTALLVLPYPDISATSDLNNGCIPLGVNFSSTVNSTGFYFWDFGDGNTSTLDNPSHIYSSDGYFDVFVRFEDLSGCVDSFDFNVTAYPVPQIGFSINQLDTCVLPANYDFINNTIGGDLFSWSFGDGLSSPLTSPSHGYSSDGVYTVQLDVSNTYGCSDSLIEVLNVNPIPNASFNIDQLDTCVIPASFDLTNNSNGALAYTWDFGDGSTSNSPNLTYSYTSDGTYDINLYSMNAFGCMDSSSTTVTVFPVPDADFTYTKFDSCVLPSNYLFTNSSSGASSYLWTFGSLANSIQSSPAFTFNNAGVYSIKLLASNNFGCSDSLIENINVAPIPIADFDLPNSIGCEPFSAIYVNGSQFANFYNWDFGDGNTGSFYNGFHNYANFGTYITKLVVEDLNGCKDSTYKTITVYPSPQADYSYVQSNPCYLPIDVDFTNNSIGAINFEWNFGNGQISSQTHPSTVYDSIGIYNTQLVVSNSYNCTDTLDDIFNVFFNQVPIAQFNFDDTICYRDTSYLNSTSLYADSLFWEAGTLNTAIGDTVGVFFDNPGEYEITLYAFNNGSGCSDTITANNSLVVLPSPTADFYYEHEYGNRPFTGKLEFFNLSANADSYFWDFGFGDNSAEFNPTYNYNYKTEGEGIYYYTLYVYNAVGCVDSSVQDLYVDYKKALYIPNALYPDHGDFEVANFIPKGTGMLEYHIEIFDTFGNVIWESKSIDAEGKPTGFWDGTYNGVPVEQDVYVWKIEATFKDDTSWEGKEFDEENKLYKTGTVTVIR